jgi:hypothetical protein
MPTTQTTKTTDRIDILALKAMGSASKSPTEHDVRNGYYRYREAAHVLDCMAIDEVNRAYWRRTYGVPCDSPEAVRLAVHNSEAGVFAAELARMVAIDGHKDFIDCGHQYGMSAMQSAQSLLSLPWLERGREMAAQAMRPMKAAATSGNVVRFPG